MPRFDSRATRPPRITVELVGDGHHPGANSSPVIGGSPNTDTWVDLADTSDSWREVIRVRAVDLRAAQLGCAAAKAEIAAAGRNPDEVDVLVDIEVMIAPDAPTARHRLAELDAAAAGKWQPQTMLYVGTPTGLAGLIADMHAVGIADGVTLLPLSLPDVLGHIAFETAPWLESLGVRMCRQGVRLLRERGVATLVATGPSHREHNTQLV